MSSDLPSSDSGSGARVPRLEILREDGPLIALNKPSGLLTQGVPHAQASLEGLVKQYLKEQHHKPGNVYLGVPHRLDRPVSGVVVFAKNSKAADRLAEQFRNRSIRKTYLAVVESVPLPTEGTLTDWLLKDATAAHVSVVSRGTEGSKQAVLDYEVIAVKGKRALVQIELHTGRMHQIRVQFGSRGWPIVGDKQYGAVLTDEAGRDYNPQVSPIGLHAWRLVLKHPVRYDDIRLEAPLPRHWAEYGFVIPRGL
ncbi:RluA family pseudouridine synthase [Schlesneria sp. T3-172]|uniref:RluA family pseudouridine synthase n=1 Tax=Schlesneria sphaerica TaxID=3373610 RepID=UPI0037C76763